MYDLRRMCATEYVDGLRENPPEQGPCPGFAHKFKQSDLAEILADDHEGSVELEFRIMPEQRGVAEF